MREGASITAQLSADLARCIKGSGLTLEEIHSKTGIDRSQLSRLKNAKVKRLDLDEAKVIYEACGDTGSLEVFFYTGCCPPSNPEARAFACAAMAACLQVISGVENGTIAAGPQFLSAMDAALHEASRQIRPASRRGRPGGRLTSRTPASEAA